jgi:hypothetical protein
MSRGYTIGATGGSTTFNTAETEGTFPGYQEKWRQDIIGGLLISLDNGIREGLVRSDA